LHATISPFLGRLDRWWQNDLMAKKKTTTSSAVRSDSDEGIDFEEALAEVEHIVAQLESGRAGLGESLQLYESGVRQIKKCHAMLHQAQLRIGLLSGFDADGNPITEALDESTMDDSPGLF